MAAPLTQQLKRPAPVPKTRLKYSLTMDASAKLQAASRYTRIPMSFILEELIQRYLPEPGQLEGRVAPEQQFDLDEFSRDIDQS